MANDLPYRSRTETLEVIAIYNPADYIGWACSATVKLDRHGEPTVTDMFGFEQYNDDDSVSRHPTSTTVPADIVEALEASALERYLERTQPADDDGGE